MYLSKVPGEQLWPGCFTLVEKALYPLILNCLPLSNNASPTALKGAVFNNVFIGCSHFSPYNQRWVAYCCLELTLGNTIFKMAFFTDVIIGNNDSRDKDLMELLPIYSAHHQVIEVPVLGL